MNKGKRLYKTTSLKGVKILALIICLAVSLNLFFKTMIDADFSYRKGHLFWDFLNYHLTYPGDILVLILLVYIPAFYYSFMRGIVFYENGLRLNRGLPFLNVFVSYDSILEYRVHDSRHLMSLIRKESQEEMLFAVSHPNRIVAIFDQRNIPGRFPDSKTKNSKRKLAYTFAAGIALVIIILQYLKVFKISL